LYEPRAQLAMLTVDPIVRKIMKVELNASTVCVFDEAHNIEDISRSSGGGLFKRNQVDAALQEVHLVLAVAFHLRLHYVHSSSVSWCARRSEMKPIGRGRCARPINMRGASIYNIRNKDAPN